MTCVVAQLTDLHLGFDQAAEREENEDRLHAVLGAVRALSPDLLIVTGDLTQGGQSHDYRRLAAALAGFACPVHLTIGNHDRRAGFTEVFPDAPGAHGFVQYTVEHPALRCIVLDTLEEGRHGGAFCDARAAWLSARLAEDARPTLILLHHPPVAVGIAWMDPDPAEPWIARLHAAVTPHPHVIGLAAGHVHSASATQWHGLPVTVAPSVAPAVALTLAPIDPARPDDRPMIFDSVPGFALHRWDGAQLTTHFGAVPGPTIAAYNEGLQPMIESIMAERAGG